MECDPTRCPTGLAYQGLEKSLSKIEKQTEATHKIVVDQAVILSQVANLQKSFDEHKSDNKKDHEEIFDRLRVVEKSDVRKITLKDALWHFGGVIAAIGGVILFIKAITGH